MRKESPTYPRLLTSEIRPWARAHRASQAAKNNSLRLRLTWIYTTNCSSNKHLRRRTILNFHCIPWTSRWRPATSARSRVQATSSANADRLTLIVMQTATRKKTKMTRWRARKGKGSQEKHTRWSSRADALGTLPETPETQGATTMKESSSIQRSLILPRVKAIKLFPRKRSFCLLSFLQYRIDSEATSKVPFPTRLPIQG